MKVSPAFSKAAHKPPRALRAARLKVSSTFSKVAGSRDGVPGRAPQSAELSCALISAGGGLRGNPRRGFPLLFILGFVRVRRYAGRWSLPPAAFRPHFFGACPKKRCRAAKEKRFFYPGISTIRVSAPASVVFTHLRPTCGGAWWLSERSSQLDAVGCYVGASSPWERRAGPNISRGGTQKRVSLGLHPVSLRKSKEMGWNWQLGPTASDQQNGAHVTAQMRCCLVCGFVRVRRYVEWGRLFPLPTEIFKDFRGFSAFIVYYRVRGGAAWASAR